MDTWNSRLAAALKESEYNAHQLAQAMGLKAPSVSAWIGAGTIQPAKNITGENLLRVCQLLNVRPEWVMFKEGPMRPPSRLTLSNEMLSVIAALEEIDRNGGTEREDALYFINRLLRKDASQERKAG
jgi:DNA-binding Xre family transcriptional regulator